MKKHIILVSTLLFFLFNILQATAPTNIFKKGVYDLKDYEELTLGTIYDIQNVSSNSDSYLLVFDKNYRLIQSILLNANSIKYNLIPLKTEYTVVVVGDGEIYLSKHNC